MSKQPPQKKPASPAAPRGKPGRKGAAPAGKKRAAPPRHEFSAGFVLFRDTPEGRLYLLLDYGRHWDYPKGHLEAGESAWQAAVRELREETGIRQVDRVGKFQRDMLYEFYSPQKGKIVKTVTFFAGRTRTSEVAVSHEHSGFAWLPYDEAMRRLTYDNAREMMRAVEETMPGAERN